MGGSSSKPIIPTTKARLEMDAKYILTKKSLGKGAFAEVFLGEEQADRKKKWAIKSIQRLGPGGKTLIDESYLRTEIHILRGLGAAHPHILTLQDYYEDEQELLLVLECAGGGTLLERINRRGAFSEADASFVSRQIVDAVAFLHANGVVHRDLKPENILTRTGKRDQVHALVADFGISKMFVVPEAPAPVDPREGGAEGLAPAPALIEEGGVVSGAAGGETVGGALGATVATTADRKDTKYVMRTVAGTQTYAAPE